LDHLRGSGGGNPSGSILVEGTLDIDGILYASTDNSDTTFNIHFTIGSGGLIRASQVSSSGGNGPSRVFFTVLSGGKLELNGAFGFAIDLLNEWGKMHNFYDFQPGSTVEYSAHDNQSVLVYSDFNNSRPAYITKYWNLVLSGSGTKTIRNDTLYVMGNLVIKDSAILEQRVFNRPIHVGGNWINHVNQNAFSESSVDTSYVKFCGNGELPNTATQTIECPGGEVFHRLWIAKDSTNGVSDRVQLLDPVTVNRQLTLGEDSCYGILDLNSNTLTLEDPAASAIQLQGQPSLTDARRFIVSEDTNHGGTVRWHLGSAVSAGAPVWEHVIPFGISPQHDTLPFCFRKNTTADIGYLSVATYATPPDNLPWPITPVAVTNLNGINNPLPDNRDWTVDRFWYVGADTPSPGCDVLFSYNNRLSTELPVADTIPQNMRAQFWETGGATWRIQQFGSAATAPYAVSVSDLPVFNTEWTLASVASPLPVELLSFDVHESGENVLVYWSTASEIDNDYFTVERSTDGVLFHPIGSIAGAGTTSQTHAYEFLDRFPLNGQSYYRLRQNDFDGRFTYSEIRSLYRKSNGTPVIYPNPSSGSLMVSFTEAISETILLTVTDMSGREIVTKRLPLNSTGNASVDLSTLPVGVYRAVLSCDGIIRNLPLVICR
jgi:hypothetical protein